MFLARSYATKPPSLSSSKATLPSIMASGPTVHWPNFTPVLPRTQKSLFPVSNWPSIANGNCPGPVDATRPKEDRPDAIPQRRVAGRSRMEVVLFVIHADEALGDEAVAEYLVADRAIAAEEVAV